MIRYYYYTIGIFLLFCFACNPDEPIPAYLQVEPWQVNANGGTAWQKLPDVWLYANTEFLGAYDLPHTIPVLAEGVTDIQLFPGVKENGIASTPAPYFIMKQWNQSVNLVPGDTTVIRPVTSYDLDAIKFAWEEERTNLDGPSPLLFDDLDTDAALNYRFTADSAFAGRSLIMPVETAHPVMTISSEAIGLPNNGQQSVWLELHHLHNVPFTLSLAGSGDNAPDSTPLSVFQFNAGSNGVWNKIYFNLTPYVARLKRSKYRLQFQAELPKDSAGKVTQSKGSVRLDNIRLLYFK